MKFGILVRPHNTLDFFERAKRDDYSRPPSFTDQRALQEQLRQIALAEELGYDALWVMEEHFSASAMTGQPLMLAAAIASRSRAMDLGVILSLAPLRDPVGTGEAIALLDNLLAGRELTIVLGHQAAPHEHEALAVPLEETHARLVESLEVLTAMFSQEWFSHAGTHWSIPAATMRPSPSSKNLARRLLLAAPALDAHDDLARYASALLHDQIGDFARTAKLDAQLRRRRTQLALPSAGSVLGFPLFCSDSPSEVEAAREWWAQAFDAEVWHYGVRHHPATRQAAAAKSGQALTAEVSKIYHKAKTAGIFGTPGQCLAELARVSRTAPVQQFVAQMHFGLMPMDAAERSVRLFAEQVLPTWREQQTRATGARDAHKASTTVRK